MKPLLFLLSCALVAGVLMLAGCQPIEVNRRVDVPISLPCHVKLPPLRSLPTDHPMPIGFTLKQKRDWMLASLYRDIVLLRGELVATREAAKGC